MTEHLTVCIVTYERPAFLLRCLDGLRVLDGELPEVVVVDASHDPVRVRAESAYPGVRYVHAPRLAGWMTRSRNEALRWAGGDVIAFLDDDVVVRPGWANAILAAFEDPAVAAVGGRTCNGMPGEEHYDLPIGALRSDGTLTDGFAADRDAPVRIDHGIGANMAFRRSVLAELGGFRDDYPGTALREDTDIFLRVRSIGGAAVFAPQAVVDHRAAPHVHGARFDTRYKLYGRRNHVVLLARDQGLASPMLRRWVARQFDGIRAAGGPIARAQRFGVTFLGVSWGLGAALRQAGLRPTPPRRNDPAGRALRQRLSVRRSRQSETDDEPTPPAVYVILTHAGWKQVQRLAAAILRSSPNSRILIAHDDRAEHFPALVDDPRIVVFTHGLPSDWGSWELVEATLAAFARARELFDPSLVTLITGADYPARSLAEWEGEALAADGWVGTASPLVYTPRWGRRRGVGDDRYTRYAMRWYRPFWSGWVETPPRWWVRLRWAVALRLEPAFGVRDVTRGRGIHYGFARMPAYFTRARPCYFGGQTLAVRRMELDRLLDEDFAPGSRLRRVFRRTVIPDEAALQTALAWRGAPADLPPVSYVRWDEEADQCVVWTPTALHDIRASRSPFCRKVDPELSEELMHELDALI